MNELRERFRSSPIYVRVAPFIIFLILTFAPMMGIGESWNYWFYLIKTAVGAWLIWEMRPFVAEMRWAFSVEAVVVGVAVFVMWVGTYQWFPHFKASGPEWNPHAQFGNNSTLAWTFLATRVLGMSLVVPVLEEVFWRSFLYRWFVRTDFQSMPLSQFHPTSFIVTSMLFGFEHPQWLAGMLCGFAFQWLVLRKNRIGDAITAHAITNFLLGVWVVWKHDWKFF
jgi:CAAX prenyl protease-like protein